MTADRCTGHYCRAFWIPYTPDQIAASLTAERARRTAAEQARAAGQLVYKTPKLPPGVTLIEDIEILADMLVYLGERHPDTQDAPQLKNGGWYTCRHHLPSGDCGNYAARPAMCRDYPYG